MRPDPITYLTIFLLRCSPDVRPSGRRTHEAPLGRTEAALDRAPWCGRYRGKLGIGWWSAGRRRTPTSLEGGSASQAFPVGLRHWPARGVSQAPRRLPALHPPRFSRREKGNTGAPAPQRNRAGEALPETTSDPDAPTGLVRRPQSQLLNKRS